MDVYFALFNSHVNDAWNKASVEFINKFGAAKYCEIIAIYHNKGIMSIFSDPPTAETQFFVETVQSIVNSK